MKHGVYAYVPAQGNRYLPFDEWSDKSLRLPMSSACLASDFID